MSEQPEPQVPVPKWMQIEINGTVTWGDTPDRMRKSLRESGIGVQEMADYLQVARNTVSTWINGRIEPSAMTLRLWALKTGVPFAWLCHGDMRPCDLRPRVGASQSRADRRTSNIMQSLAGRAVA